jgi:hypothetical protein
LAVTGASPHTAVAAAGGVLESFPDRYHDYWCRGMRAKLWLAGHRDNGALIDDLPAPMAARGLRLRV